MDFSGNFAMYNGGGSQTPLPRPPQMTSYPAPTYQIDEFKDPLSQPVFPFEVPSQSQKPTFHETSVQNEQVKPQLPAHVRGKEKAKEKAAPKPRGGRQQGVTNFGETATMELLKVVDKWLPIGADGWNAVRDEYNNFAKGNKLLERDVRSLKHKFDKLVNTAMEKPTGEANRSELLDMALKINERIDDKSGIAVLDDDEEGVAGVSDKHKVIHLTSDGESAAEEPSKMAKTVKSPLVVKGYRTANPLEIKTRKPRTSTSQAMEAMSAVGAYFSADRVREREDTRTTNSLHMMQLQSAQTELREARSEVREAHSEVKRLSESLNTETRRADKLDMHVIHLKEKVEELKAENSELKADLRSMQQRRRHHHNVESDSEADSSPHRRTRRRRRHLTPPSPSQRGVATAPDGSNTHESPCITSPKTRGAALPDPFM